MANKKFDYDRIYNIVMECRSSGLSDRQWCIEHGIPGSTFYYWVRRLRQETCREIPGHTGSAKENRIVPKPEQDVVCVNISQAAFTPETSKLQNCFYPQTAECITLCYQGANLTIPEEFSEKSLFKILNVLKEALC